MEIEYSSNKLEKQLSDAKQIKIAFGVNAKRVAARMDDIRSSPNLKVLLQISSANCHQLSGNRKDQWSVNISANHRLVFEINNNPIPILEDNSIDTIKITDILIIETVDYHKD